MTWKQIWRAGIAPLLSITVLEALRLALLNDDPRLLQSATTQPPPLNHVGDWPCEAACPIGFCGLAEGLDTVSEINDYFGAMCHEVGKKLGDPAAIRWFLNWVDDTPREEMRRELLTEVNRALQKRREEQAA